MKYILIGGFDRSQRSFRAVLGGAYVIHLRLVA